MLSRALILNTRHSSVDKNFSISSNILNEDTFEAKFKCGQVIKHLVNQIKFTVLT